MKVEYRVRPVTRYIVTRYFEGMPVENEPGNLSKKTATGSEFKGVFDSYDIAYQVGYALAKEEHARLGYPVGDERIKYPDIDGNHATQLESPVPA